MKILVDADACLVLGLLKSLQKEWACEIILVSDYLHDLQAYGLTHIEVSKEKDSADRKILSLLDKGDILVTNDLPLAALALVKGAKVLSFSGNIYTAENIDALLFARHLNAKARRGGERVKGPKKRTKQEDEQFLGALLQLLNGH